MKFITKQKLFFITLLGIYGVSRLGLLHQIPWFVDESIYALWAQQGFYDESLRLVSLSDGKQPLFVWLTTIMMNLIGNPITAGRLVSVVTGAITLVGIMFLTKQLFQKNAASRISGVLFVLSPFSFILNRMALFDSTAGMFAVWSLVCAVALVQTVRLDIALISGLVYGAGILNRQSGFTALYLLPVSLLLKSSTVSLASSLKKWLPLATITVVLSLLYYAVLNLSPDFATINEKNKIFFYSIHEAFSTEVLIDLPQRAWILFRWICEYFSVPLIVLSGYSVLYVKSYTKQKMYLWIFIILPLAGLVLLGKRMNPRYLYFLTIPLYPLIATASEEISHLLIKRKYASKLVIILFIPLTITTLSTIINLSTSFIPYEDKFQYINGWPAGGGTREMVALFKKEAQDKKIVVATEGEYGSLPTTVMSIYFRNDENIIRIPFSDPVLALNKIMQTYTDVPIFVVLNILPTPPWTHEEIAKFPKGSGTDSLRVYKVNQH